MYMFFKKETIVKLCHQMVISLLSQLLLNLIQFYIILM
jgi:hypothetical protein